MPRCSAQQLLRAPFVHDLNMSGGSRPCAGPARKRRQRATVYDLPLQCTGEAGSRAAPFLRQASLRSHLLHITRKENTVQCSESKLSTFKRASFLPSSGACRAPVDFRPSMLNFALRHVAILLPHSLSFLSHTPYIYCRSAPSCPIHYNNTVHLQHRPRMDFEKKR